MSHAIHHSHEPTSNAARDAIAAAEPKRVRVLDATRSREEVSAAVWKLVERLL